MERLSKKTDENDAEYFGTLRACGKEACNEDCFECEDLTDAIEKLAAYENTGLEPSEVEELRAVADKAKANAKERIDEFDMLPNYYKKAEKRIALLDKALDVAARLYNKLTRQRLLELAEEELKAEGENEKQNNS